MWTEELESVFEDSKRKIIEAICAGVRIFDPRRKTCLHTDWSKSGMGFLLAQKYCNCNLGRSYGCCVD